MRFQSRIKHTLGAKPISEPPGNLATVCVVRGHAQVQCLRASKDEPGIHRSGHGTCCIEYEVQTFSEPVITKNDDPANHIAVPIQVLRARVVNDVGTEVEWPLEHRCSKRVVDDQQRAGFSCELCSSAEVRESHER